MDDAQKAAAKARIAEIDAMFDAAIGWGSWMVSASNERESIVDRLRDAGESAEHKHLARHFDDRPTD